VRDIDAQRAAAIFGLSEMVLAVPLVLWRIADLVFAPAGHAFSPTLLLAMAWSIFVAYQGVRSAFVVVRWRAPMMRRAPARFICCASWGSRPTG
jgi:hypothetical protein